MSVLRIRNKDETASIAVLDSRLTKKAKAVGHVELSLPDGVYKVEVRVGSSLRAEVIILERDLSLNFDVRTFSPAPIDATAQSDEELMRFALKGSRNAAANGSGGSSIYVFARNANFLGRVSLTRLDSAADSGLPALKSDFVPGASAFGARVEPGAYRLNVNRFEGDLCQAIYAVFGRQTQVFLPETKSESGGTLESAYTAGPDMAGASVFCGSEHGFDPYARHLRFQEHAKSALQDGLQNTPNEVRDAILWAAVDDPIIGIMAGYLLLGRANQQAQTRGILERLRTQVGDQFPDVEALALALGLETQYRFRYPPMLRVAWEAALRASARAPWIVPGDSKLNELAGHVVPGSVWLLWLEPPPPPVAFEEPGRSSAKDQIVKELAEMLRSQSKGKQVKTVEVGDEHIEIDRDALEQAIQTGGLPAAELERKLEQYSISIKWR